MLHFFFVCSLLLFCFCVSCCFVALFFLCFVCFVLFVLCSSGNKSLFANRTGFEFQAASNWWLATFVKQDVIGDIDVSNKHSSTAQSVYVQFVKRLLWIFAGCKQSTIPLPLVANDFATRKTTHWNRHISACTSVFFFFFSFFGFCCLCLAM